MKILKIFSYALFAMVLTGCGGSSDDPVVVIEDDKVIVEPTMVTLFGTVAIGTAIAGADIVVTGKDGNTIEVTAVTDANGNYSIEFDGELPTPVLISVITADGEKLSAIVDDPNATIANVNPITTYVADTLLADTDLSAISAGDVATAGQKAVTSLFGAGAQYDAFSSDTFIAKSDDNDFDTQASVADVLLDSISQLAGATDVATFIAQAAEAEATLLDSAEFIISVATNLALVKGTESNIEEIFNLQQIDATIAAQLTDVITFQEIVEGVISLVEASGLTTEQEIAATAGLIEIIADVVISDNIIDITIADAVSQNVVDNLLDDIVNIVTSDEVADLSTEELIATARNTAGVIITIITNTGIDLTGDNLDLSAIEEELAHVIVIIANSTDWDNGKWGTLIWQ
ncbi:MULTISPECIES: carboxypeptidase-like regulatory domain-containing protein [Colwellia]|uniref:Bacterial Ig domain-containing protein n=1 Tax=Colwellia marinimaniae TaxID=1513592 RepID=A0ABQ0MZX1_9GAMM|nr:MULTISPECIES: carboxypeptidase-like regulatory domain-containing protein [Colwellia]GAW97905.1 hypothetical protein MTCD1_03557 [Colwellia marinimaniae]